MNTNLFYYKDLNSIGGIETFFYNLAQKYGGKYDITILYQTGDPEQVKRLSKLVRVKKYREGEKVRCKRCFCTFNVAMLDNIEADEYYQILHGDYRSLGVCPASHPKITEWMAVSKVVRDSYSDITGKIADVCYNPLVLSKPKKVLRLISATRLTPDKGYQRMQQLAAALDEKGIPYTWDVYSDQRKPFTSKSIAVREPRLDIIDFIADADYFVQLSDAEGFCYSVVESLSVGTPVIVTDFKVAREIGVQDRVNGFILPMDMSDIPIDDIYKGLKEFKYTAPVDRWDEFLLPVPPDYAEQMAVPVRIRCKKQFYDLERKKMVEYGEEWVVPTSRYEILYDLNVVEMVPDEHDSSV